MRRSIGMSSKEASRAMLSASGLPVPSSIRDKVEADTPVCSATSRKLKPCCSRRRRTAQPSSEVLIPVFFAIRQAYHPSVLAARLCFIVATSSTSCQLAPHKKEAGHVPPLNHNLNL